MGAKRKPNGLTGEVHPSVLEAAGMNPDNEEFRGWIAERYGQPFASLPVYFAETFDQWDRLEEDERNRQIQLEEQDPIGGQFTMIGAMMGEGILRFRDRFARACAAAVSVGDREFFQVFQDVYAGLGQGKYPIPFRAFVVRTWNLLANWNRGTTWNDDAKQHVESSMIKGESPTVAEIREHLIATRRWIDVAEWPTDPDGAIRRILKKHGLDYADDDRGGDRRSKRWDE